MRVVERAGVPLKSLLQRSDVEPQLDCLDKQCPVCLTSPKGLCRMEGVGYNIWCEAVHDGEEVSFGCAVVSRFPGDPLSRQIQEAVRIDHQEGTSMNDKSEFVRPAGVRIRAERM